MILLKAVLGFIVGAVIGAVVAVFLAGIWFFSISPLFQQANWDNPGIGFMPLLAAPFGAIIGGALGAVRAARQR